MKGTKVIDLMLGLNPPGTRSVIMAHYPHLLRDAESTSGKWSSAAEFMFKDASARMVPGTTPENLIDLMDEAGVERGMVTVYSDGPEPTLKVIDKYPQRFFGKLHVNPNRGMDEVRLIDRLVRNHGIKAVGIMPCAAQKAPNDKVFYPIYSKCIELDIPVTTHVFLDGPRIPCAMQDPIYLDEVCWFFPELKVVMMHGGEPWAFTCVKLMLKWPNLFFMTSAYAPRFYPKEIVDFANTRGAHKIMFAGYYPSLDYHRIVPELEQVPFKDHVWPQFLRENAMKVFKL